MPCNKLLKTILIIFCLITALNCKDSNTVTNPIALDTSYEQLKITSKDIEGIKYTEYALSNLSEKKIEDWLRFQELNTQIEILQQGDLSYFNDENELLTTFLKELKEQIPETINTPSIQARISVLETSAFKLEGINNLKNLDKKTILIYIRDVLVAHSNLILQINKKLEQDSQNIEKPN